MSLFIGFLFFISPNHCLIHLGSHKGSVLVLTVTILSEVRRRDNLEKKNIMNILLNGDSDEVNGRLKNNKQKRDCSFTETNLQPHL